MLYSDTLPSKLKFFEALGLVQDSGNYDSNDRDLVQAKKLPHEEVTVTLTTKTEAEINGNNKNLFEGDIMPDAKSISEKYGSEKVEELRASGMILEDTDLRQSRNVWYNLRWTDRQADGLVHVPYYFAPGNYTSSEKTIIRDALAELATQSKVVVFDEMADLTSPPTYFLFVFNDGGCYSYVGRVIPAGYFGPTIPGQPLSLTKPSASSSGTCLRNGIIQHEFMHAIGFWHEQSRSDRDDYVTINIENVIPGYENNFNKESTDPSYNLGSPYEYGSVMHCKFQV